MRLERVLLVADLADGGAAVDVHLADLAGAQPDLRVVAFTREQLHRGARRARELRALPGSISTQWLVVPTGMFRSGSVLPGLDRRIRAGHELHAAR